MAKLATLLASTFLAVGVLAAPAQAEAPLSKSDVEGIIKQYIADHPEAIVESLEKMRANQRAQMQELMQKAAETNKDALMKDKDDPWTGNPNATVTITEFFDYHCGYCKQVVPTLTKLLEEDKDIRLVFKDFPILSPDSELAAKASVAFHRLNKEKHFDFHRTLMETKGKFDEAKLQELASKHGVKGEDLKKEMDKPEVAAVIAKHRDLAKKLAITGTPMIYVNTKLLPGAASLESLKAAVKEVREGKPAEKKEEKNGMKKDDKKS